MIGPNGPGSINQRASGRNNHPDARFFYYQVGKFIHFIHRQTPKSRSGRLHRWSCETVKMNARQLSCQRPQQVTVCLPRMGRRRYTVQRKPARLNPGWCKRCAYFEVSRNFFTGHRNAIDVPNITRLGPVDLEPNLTAPIAKRSNPKLHLGAMKKTAVGNQAQNKLSAQPKAVQNTNHSINRLRKLGGTGWLPVPRKCHIHQSASFWRNVPLHEITVQNPVQELGQLRRETIKIKRRRPTSHKVFNLTIKTGPVARIVYVQIDANRHPSCPA